MSNDPEQDIIKETPKVEAGDREQAIVDEDKKAGRITGFIGEAKDFIKQYKMWVINFVLIGLVIIALAVPIAILFSRQFPQEVPTTETTSKPLTKVTTPTANEPVKVSVSPYDITMLYADTGTNVVPIYIDPGQYQEIPGLNREITLTKRSLITFIVGGQVGTVDGNREANFYSSVYINGTAANMDQYTNKAIGQYGSTMNYGISVLNMGYTQMISLDPGNHRISVKASMSLKRNFVITSGTLQIVIDPR